MSIQNTGRRPDLRHPLKRARGLGSAKDGTGHFMTLDWPGLEVVGREAVDVTVFAPSVVAASETFDVTVRAEGRYMNRGPPKTSPTGA